jgi:hypothetical protein
MTDTTPKYGFRDNVHEVTVGPMAKEGTFREKVACGHRRITQITALTFDMTYPAWVIGGNREKLIKAHTEDLAERVHNARANHSQV